MSELAEFQRHFERNPKATEAVLAQRDAGKPDREVPVGQPIQEFFRESPLTFPGTPPIIQGGHR